MTYEAWWDKISGGRSPRRVVHEVGLTRDTIDVWLDRRVSRVGEVAEYRKIALTELRQAFDSLRPGAHAAMLAKIAPKRMVRVFVDLTEPDFAALVQYAQHTGKPPAEALALVVRGLFAPEEDGRPSPMPRLALPPPRGT